MKHPSRTRMLAALLCLLLAAAIGACSAPATTPVATQAATQPATQPVTTVAGTTPAASGTTTVAGTTVARTTVAGTTAAPTTAAPRLDYNDPKVPQFNIMVRDVNQTIRAESGMNENDNIYSRFVFDHSGIKVNLMRQPDTEYDAKVQLTLNANDGSVDMLFLGYSANILAIAQSGALLPLNDKLADAKTKYPHLADTYDAQYWSEVSFSKDQLLLANNNTRGNTQAMLIRKDWLDKVNLQVPKTIPELYEAAKAFVAAKPDGKTPTYGLSGRKNLSYLATQMSAAYGNPSFNPQYAYMFIDKKNKKLDTWNTSDGARAFFTEIQKWWKEGLIDKEALLNDGAGWWDLIYNGNLGIISHQTISTGWLTNTIRETLKSDKPELVYVPPFTGTGFTNQYGNTAMTAADKYDSFYGFPRAAKNIDNALKYFDWLCSPEGMHYSWYGIDGVENILKDGKRIPNPANKTGFSGEYVFTGGNPKLVNAEMREYQIAASAGNAEDTQFDTAAASYKRVEESMRLDFTIERPPFDSWVNTLPKTDVESIYADYASGMTSLYVRMIQGLHDASTEAGWQAYLNDVKATGYLDVVEAKSKWVQANKPDLFN